MSGLAVEVDDVLEFADRLVEVPRAPARLRRPAPPVRVTVFRRRLAVRSNIIDV